MNYERLYFKLCERYKEQEIPDGVYTEVHHIVPRYAGGTDEETNLVRVTYKQHVFLHKLLAKYTKDFEAICAYRLMSSIDVDKKREISAMAGRIGGAKNRNSGHMSRLGKHQGKITGRRNVESGFLDEIREKANTPVRQAKLRLLHDHLRETGHYAMASKKAQDAWRGKSHTKEWKKERSLLYKERYKCPEKRAKLAEMQKMAVIARKDKSYHRSLSIIENAQRNEEYLHKKSNRSKNKFVSPEGLVFDSPLFAAKYYNLDLESHVVDNFCKDRKHGWYRIPKTAED